MQKMNKTIIYLEDALDAFGLSEKTRKYGGDHSGYDTRMLYEIQGTLESLPPAQPEPEEFEWCHDCKEYDQEKHCCHRFTKVIRNTVEELKAYPITEDEAIKYLQETGWMDQHDKEMIDKGLNVQLADDSDSYNSLVPERMLFPTIHIVGGYDTVEDENGNKGFGLYIPGDKVIYVAGDVPCEIKLKTLFHELCHWIQDISGREFNEFEAENFSNFMYGVIDMTIDLYKSGEVKTEGQG